MERLIDKVFDRENFTKLAQQKFGEVIFHLRKKVCHISQEKLAELSGLDTTYISHLENGKKQASLSTILLLASALNISSSDLMEKVEALIYNQSN